MPETIKPVPSLIIGIGGTGVMVATHVRKELLEISTTDHLPPGVRILAFDTESQLRIRVGGWGRPREPGVHRTGAVELQQGEYVSCESGGDRGDSVRNKAKEVAAEQHQYLGTWWNAQEYLNANLPSTVWGLTRGAGQLRQFGRVALFEKRQTITDMLTSAITNIKNEVSGTSELYVHIAGSFVGGTGSGMFIDISHLASVVAKRVGIPDPHVFGYFALVDAFLGTPEINLSDSNKKRMYEAQAYACLRECSRFMMATHWATGYPMHYADIGDRHLLLGELTEPPYDAVYLFDGHRSRHPLFQFVIEEGIAPTIADTIVANVDAKSGTTFTAHTVNSYRQRTALGIPENTSTYGAVGTFTLVFPIFHVVEEWTHRLAKEVLDELLVPTDWDKDTGIPNVLASNKRGGTSAESLGDGAEKGRDWLKHAPTGLVQDLGQVGEKHSRQATQNEAVNDLKSRSIETWIKLLKPEDMTSLTSDAIERATLVLESDLTKEKVKRGGVTEPNEYYVHPSPGGSDRDQADQVASETRKMFRVLVGEENEETGRREGGRVKATLDDLKAIHITKFRTAIRTTLEEVLNGSAGANALEAKAGKLGFMLAYLKQVRDDLREARSAIEKTEGGRRESSASRRRAGGSERESVEGFLKETDEKMRKGGGLLGANRKTYLTTAQSYLQILKKEIAERVTWETVNELIQVADDAHSETLNWAETLGSRNSKDGGLYALVFEGRKNNKDDRDRMSLVRVREQIKDTKYEDAKYHGYVSRGGSTEERTQLRSILKDLAWDVHVDTNTGRIRLGLKLGTNTLSSNKGQHAGDTNARFLLDRCRTIFEGAWEDLSILKYLMNRYGPTQQETIVDLAKAINAKSGPLLQVSASPFPSNFLRAHRESAAQIDNVSQQHQAQEQQSFLDLLTNELAEMNHLKASGGAQQGGQVMFGHTPSSDRFKLSFVYFSELNQLKDIGAYTQATGEYRSYPGRKTWLHVFPAEQHAVHYEEQLGKMSPAQRPREFDDRVVVQLENLERFKFIVRCLVYGSMTYDWKQSSGRGTGLLLYKTVPPQEENPDSKEVYRLSAEPRGEMRGGNMIDPLDGKPAVSKHWDLTKLSRPASLLESFNQFNYLKHAHGNDQDQIDDERVTATLEKAVEWDRAIRAARRFPWRAPDGWSAEQVRDAERRVALYLKYQEARNDWLKELQKDYRPVIIPGQPPVNMDPNIQREADLRTVIVLFLDEEIRSLKDQIDRYGGTWLAAPTVELEPVVAVASSTQPAPVTTPPASVEPSMPVAMPSSPAPNGIPKSDSDLMAQLERLAKLKEQGVLCEEEFKAAKAKLLGL